MVKFINKLDIYHETQKLYEEYYYKKTTNSTKVNYKAEKKLKSDRVFYIDKRPENKPSTDLDPKKVDDGKKIASNYSGNNINKSSIDGFYFNSGKELPSQFDMRNMTELTNFWKNEEDKIERPKLEFGTRKMKEDLVEERKEKMKKSKKGEIIRKEVCDERYFKYNKKI